MIDEQSSASGHDYASYRSAIGAGCWSVGTCHMSNPGKKSLMVQELVSSHPIQKGTSTSSICSNSLNIWGAHKSQIYYIPEKRKFSGILCFRQQILIKGPWASISPLIFCFIEVMHNEFWKFFIHFIISHIRKATCWNIWPAFQYLLINREKYVKINQTWPWKWPLEFQ